MAAVLRVSPNSRYWACAFEAELKVFDTSSSSFIQLEWNEEKEEANNEPEAEAEPKKKRKKRGKTVDLRQLEEVVKVVRFVAFDEQSQYMAAGGDDKVLRLWKCEGAAWKVIATAGSATLGKRFTGGLFYGNRLLAVDKFGDVNSYSVPELQDEKEELGHFTMVSGLLLQPPSASAGGALISCDVDGHIRVSELRALCDIRSFCLGHVGPVGDICLVDGRLVSGGEGGVLCLWDSSTGSKLASHTASELVFANEAFVPFISALRCSAQGVLAVAANPFAALLFFRIVPSSSSSTASSASSSSSSSSSAFEFRALPALKLPGVPVELCFVGEILCVWLKDYPLQFFALQDETFVLIDPPTATLRTMRDELKAEFHGAISNLEDFSRRKTDRIRREAETKVRVEANKAKVRARLQSGGGEAAEASDQSAEGDEEEEI